MIGLLLLNALPALAQAPSQTPSKVQVQTLSSIALHPERAAQAQVVSQNDSKLSAEVAARITAIPVQVGQQIKKGAVVAQLECADYNIAAQRASAQLEAAKARAQLTEMQVKRARELSQSGFISKDALDGRMAELKVSQAERDIAAAQLAAAQREVGKCQVRAPFDAVVQSKLGQVGEMAAPGTPLISLVDMRRMEVVAELQQKAAQSVQETKAWDFETQGQRYALKLLRVSPVLNLQTRSREARFTFAKQAAAPGFSGRVLWHDSQMHVPPQYVVARNKQFGVFVLRDGRARFVDLPEAQQGRPAAVGEALPADAVVITMGHLALQDGQAVQVAR